ncbi:subtilisin-like protease SBT4.15 [Bidens hawaiensis]|uniref:subtilisin-like protease SBT4.15 n=1 Tax=Bidens hawaiensis TaxID=980011 RepID=UPI004049F5C6
MAYDGSRHTFTLTHNLRMRTKVTGEFDNFKNMIKLLRLSAIAYALNDQVDEHRRWTKQFSDSAVIETYRVNGHLKRVIHGVVNGPEIVVGQAEIRVSLRIDDAQAREFFSQDNGGFCKMILLEKFESGRVDWMSKLIGAQYSHIGTRPDQNLSPEDKEGHGSHTASTAAGVPVEGANVYSIGKGTARGGVHSARIAAYKVCWHGSCSEMDLLAGFDMAIADGVDVITVSIGGHPRQFFQDSLAIGAFHVMKKGIFVACSAGNEGPHQLTVKNIAPWVTTMAASTSDRQFVSDVQLGNGATITGIAMNTFPSTKKMYPLISGARAANASQIYRNAGACDFDSLSDEMVKGKIVHCLGKNEQDVTLYTKRVAGLILSQDKDYDLPSSFLIPGSTVSIKEGLKIDHYINSTRKPVATIRKTRSIKMADAPFVASFSSRGPQFIAPNILKPDVAAPGLGILAAYSKLSSMTGHPEFDKRFVDYKIASGTSMACPHVAAAAAYVKSFHPTWSPAAIKSALMTTGSLWSS